MTRGFSGIILPVGAALLVGCARLAARSTAPTREAIYPEFVTFMHRLEKANPDERPAVLDQVKNRLPSWYSAIDATPPDTSDPNWITVTGYDLMPDRLFEEKVEETRRLFLKMDKPFPGQVTRRELLRLVEDLIRQMQE